MRDSFVLENLKARLQDRWRDDKTRTTWATVALSIIIFVSLSLLALTFITARDTRPSAFNPGKREVVLYSSADDAVVKLLIAEFEKQSGISVKFAGDTEATKSAGLVQRIIDEGAADKDGSRPNVRADVWWSSELVGTMRLAREGALEPVTPRTESDFPGGWPPLLRASDRSWHGFAQRARVIAYNTNRLGAGQVPTTLRAFTDPMWNGRVGMARPQFGTTRGHIAALVAENPRGVARAFLISLRDNKVRFYSGNSAVVRALSTGEIDVGLTDSDDVWAAQREKWPVACVYETLDDPKMEIEGLKSLGPLMIPNTVAKIRGGPHPQEALKLIDFLLSAEAERLLAQSESANIPIRDTLRDEFAKQVPTQPALQRLEIPDPWQPDPFKLAAAESGARALVKEIFGE